VNQSNRILQYFLSYIFDSNNVAYNDILPECIPELHFGMHMYSVRTVGLVLVFIVFAVVYIYLLHY
jgi:hypothetical protein